MKTKFLLIFPLIILVSGCATTTPELNKQKIKDCTGLGILKVNDYDKKSHLFNKNDPYYIKKYAPHTAFSQIRIKGCTNLATGEKSVRLFKSLSTADIRYGTFYQSTDTYKVFDTFLDSISENKVNQKLDYQTANQQISQYKAEFTTVPKHEPDWYIDVERYSKQPVLVTNARDKASYGLMSNRTLALTEEDVKYIRSLMTQYWGQ